MYILVIEKSNCNRWNKLNFLAQAEDQKLSHTLWDQWHKYAKSFACLTEQIQWVVSLRMITNLSQSSDRLAENFFYSSVKNQFYVCLLMASPSSTWTPCLFNNLWKRFYGHSLEPTRVIKTSIIASPIEKWRQLLSLWFCYCQMISINCKYIGTVGEERQHHLQDPGTFSGLNEKLNCKPDPIFHFENGINGTKKYDYSF